MVIARAIKGRYRRYKTIFSLILLLIFIITPFVYINGHPALLLDIAERKFHVFGLIIWPQELFLLNVVLFCAGITLFLATALGGRLWCAYGCPQSVLTDLYDWVGRLVAGTSYGKRSMTRLRMLAVQFSWLLLSMVLALIFIRYFVPADEIITTLQTANFFIAPDSLQLKTWIYFFFIITIFSFITWGFFRENVCNYVCPYGRFQAAMLDSFSPIVQYDYLRGEPRRQKDLAKTGDCTSCNMCVAVCPTGIDIRNGMQVGCIHCGLCIDACEKEMGRHEKITLIAKESLNTYAKRTGIKMEGVAEHKPKVRPRILLYSGLLLIFVALFTTLLVKRSPLHISVLQDQNIRHMVVGDNSVRNGFLLQLANKTNTLMELMLQVATLQEKYKNKLTLIGNGEEKILIQPGQFINTRAIVDLNVNTQEKINDSVQIKFLINDSKNNIVFESERIIFNLAY